MDLKVKQWYLIAKRDGICEETKREIKIGDKILYLPAVRKLCKARVFCKESEEYQKWYGDAHSGYSNDFNKQS